MPYELIDHTADMGIHVTGTDMKDLFRTAARGMVEQMTDTGCLKGGQRMRLEVSGIDRTDLLVNWLRELLSLWTVSAYLVKDTVIRDINDTRLTADILYDEYQPGRHDMYTDIKAVTWHGASVVQTEKGWEASIIFDV